MVTERKGVKAMFFDGDWSKLRGWEFGPLAFFYVIWFSIRGLVANRGTVLTASLAFATALSVVPLLSVALWVLLTLGGIDDGTSLEPYIQQLFPAAASGIVAYLSEFARTSASEVAGIGALTFYVIAFFLFVSIERAFNIIWASHRKRPVAQQIGAFMLIMTFGPVFLSLSFGLSAYATIRLEQFNVNFGVVLALVPVLLAFAVFTAMNHFLPTARVRVGYSVMAGLFTAGAFELGKYGFNLYVTELVLVPYNQVYGALGLFPLFLVWLYVIWLIVLFGAELAYTSQNLQTLVRVENAARRGPGRVGEYVFNPTIGLELYAPIARAFKSGDGRLSDVELVAITGYPEVVVRTVVDELARIGALEVVEEDEGERRLLPAKQLEDIELWPMLEAFFDFRDSSDAQPVRDLIRQYRTISLDVLASASAMAFIAPEDRSAPTPARAAAPAPRNPTPLPARPAEPLAGAPRVDADLFDSPPEIFTDAQGPTLDAKPLQKARAIADRAKNLSSERAGAAKVIVEPAVPEFTAVSPRPMAAVDAVDEPTAVEASDDGIRIHTQDILVEDEAVVTPTMTPGSAAQMLKRAMKSSKGKGKKKKEPSIEIDIAGMWDDFEVDNYDEVLAQASGEMRRTDELPGDLGNEKSSPPPMPSKKK